MNNICYYFLAMVFQLTALTMAHELQPSLPTFFECSGGGQRCFLISLSTESPPLVERTESGSEKKTALQVLVLVF